MADLLTTKEAAAMLGIKPQTLRKWRMKGYGPRPVKGLPRGFGNPVYYTKGSLDEFTFRTKSLTNDYSE